MARDLCALADVQAYLGGEADDEKFEGLLSRLIATASAEVHRDTGREIKVVGSNPQTRTFDLDEYEVCERELDVGDLATTPAGVTIKRADGELVETVDLADVVVLPRVREEWEPIGTLRFLPGVTLARGYVVEVAGAWGFPLVPDDVRHYAIVKASEWFIREFPSLFDPDEAIRVRVEASRLARGLGRYHVPTVA